MRYVAVSQIQYGTAPNFGVVNPGEEFDPRKLGLVDQELARLLTAGHAAPFTARAATQVIAPSPAPAVAIPADWEKLKGKEAVDLARLLGAPETVTAEEAVLVLRQAVADRLAGR
ncbi:MAG: hypothetical protein KIS73_24760 [Enhydrobacter sp.]|nr:hypothetical protein [Enhydrobacter sp.]